MQNTSATWKSLAATDGVVVQAKAIINGVEYTDIEPPVITRGCMQAGVSIGNVVSAFCTFTLDTENTIPKSAEVAIKMRLVGGTEDSPVYSEWLPAGTFYISRRRRHPQSNVIDFECYDSLLKANSVLDMSQVQAFLTDRAGNFITDADGNKILVRQGLEPPYNMEELAYILAALIGIDIDSRTVLDDDYSISEIADGATIRDELSIIAQVNCGNWIVTPENKLRLVPIIDNVDSEETDTVVDVDAVVGEYYVGTASQISGVRTQVGDNTSIVGDESGLVVDVTVSAIYAVDIAETLIGITYIPFTFGSAYYDPATEMGDFVSYAGHTCVLYSEAVTLGPAPKGLISAPDVAELADEFPYIGGGDKTLALAKVYAEEVAQEAVADFNSDLTQQEIFNRLTDNGTAQGLVLYNGQLYINASYIQAGRINVGLIDFTNYDDYEFLIPNEYDSSTLFSGQSIVDGWITHASNTITVVECDNATALQGKRIVVSVETKTLVDGGSTEYATLEGGGSEVWGAAAYGQEDAEGNLIGATGQGEFYRYETSWVVPDDATWFRISFDTAGARAIRVSADTTSDFALMYGNNIAISYKGLQVGKFVVDKSGNVTSGARNQFDGAVYFNGSLYFDNPADVRTSLGVPSTTGSGASGTWGIDVTGSAGSVAWGNVTGKPANYPGGCTGIAGGVAWGNVTNKAIELITTSSLNANDVRTTNGIWICNAAITNAPTTNHGALIGGASVGTPFQYFIPDNSLYIYKRWYSSSAWNSWQKISAGYADSAGTASSCSGNAASASSVAWENVSGKPGNYPGGCTGNAASASSVAWGNVTGKPNVATTDTAQTFTGTKSWGSSGAGGQLNGAATNGGINSIKIGDDVWLGDCNKGGIMGMKSTGGNCGFYMYNSSGTEIGQLYFDGTYLQCNKTINTSITGNAANVTGTVAVDHGGTGATSAGGARTNLGITSGTKVATFSSGKATLNFSDFGVSSRPSVLMLTAQNANSAIYRYDYDNSTSNIVINAYKPDGSAVANGSHRFCWICIP